MLYSLLQNYMETAAGHKTVILHVPGMPRAAVLNLVLPNFPVLDVWLLDFVLMVIYSKS